MQYRVDPEKSDRGELRSKAAFGRYTINASASRNDLIFLSMSSNDIAPLIISPSTKKVGVAWSFSVSKAKF